jgi:hypothetical protein
MDKILLSVKQASDLEELVGKKSQYNELKTKQESPKFK